MSGQLSKEVRTELFASHFDAVCAKVCEYCALPLNEAEKVLYRIDLTKLNGDTEEAFLDQLNTYALRTGHLWVIFLQNYTKENRDALLKFIWRQFHKHEMGHMVSDDDIDNLCVDTWMTALEKSENWNPEQCKFLTFVFGIAKMKSLDLGGKLARRRGIVAKNAVSINRYKLFAISRDDREEAIGEREVAENE
jgi:hypothetical protein